MADIVNRDEYDYLVDHCKAILTERIKNSREEMILAYAEVGEEIITNPIYKKFGKGNNKFLENLFVDIGIGKTNGYYCIKFYEFLGKNSRVKEVSTAWKEVRDIFKEGDNISWDKIKKNYLPDRKEKEKPEECLHEKFYKVCIDCGKKL